MKEDKKIVEDIGRNKNKMKLTIEQKMKTETKTARENVGLWRYISTSYVAWLLIGGEMWK